MPLLKRGPSARIPRAESGPAGGSMTTSSKLTTAAFFRLSFLLVLVLIWPVTTNATDGHFLHGSGPVNEAMGGADTGLCLDATGSIAWNPACTARFMGRRFELHGTIFVPWRSLSSTVMQMPSVPECPARPLVNQGHGQLQLLPESSSG